MYDGDLVVKALPDGKRWEITQPFRFITHLQKDWMTVRAGFITDFASIPKVLFSVFGGAATGKFRKAAVCHDYLYHTQQLSRGQSDMIFLILMIADDVPYWKAYLMYAAVRVFGGKAWRENV